MDLDLNKLSCSELRKLNHAIVAILKARRQTEAYRALASFQPGDHVEFAYDGGFAKGYVARVNKKTLSIDTYEPLGQWRVSPAAVKKIADTITVESSSNVLSLFGDEHIR